MTEQKIQAYVLGELPPEEAALVAEALAQAPALAALAREYEQIAEGFRQQRVAALQQELLAFDQTLPAPPTRPAPAPRLSRGPDEERNSGAAPTKPRRFTWWPFLLAVTLLIGALVVFLPQDGPPAEASLSERYYEPPANPTTAGNQSQDAAYRQAINQFFNEEDYSGAHQRFSSLAEVGDYQTAARFYLPHASFSLSQHKRAEVEFDEALADANMKPEWAALLRWNNMINDLEQGRDITGELARTWPPGYRAGELRKELAERANTNQ